MQQRAVLTEAAVVLCHGGSGTTFGALEAGVPLVVVPVLTDQLRQALLRVLHDGAYRAQAGALRRAVRAPPQLPDVLDDLLPVEARA